MCLSKVDFLKNTEGNVIILNIVNYGSGMCCFPLYQSDLLLLCMMFSVSSVQALVQ